MIAPRSGSPNVRPVTRRPRSAAAPGSPPSWPPKPASTAKWRALRPNRKPRPRLPRRGRGTRSSRTQRALGFAPQHSGAVVSITWDCDGEGTRGALSPGLAARRRHAIHFFLSRSSARQGTRTRTNTGPYGTEASAAGRSGRACVARAVSVERRHGRAHPRRGYARHRMTPVFVESSS